MRGRGYFWPWCCLGAVEVYGGTQDDAALTWNWALLRDAGGAFDLSAVRELPDTVWEEQGHRVVNLGYTQDAIWVRVRVNSERDTPIDCFAELKSTRIEYVDWFVMAGTNLIEQMRSGSVVRQIKRVPDLRRPSIAFLLPARQERELYIRLRAQVAVQIAPWQLMPANEFVGDVTTSEFHNVLLIGMMMGLLVLVYLSCWSTREILNIYYALGMTLLGLIFPIMGGYHVWLDWPWLDFWTHDAVLLLTNLSMMFPADSLCCSFCG